MGVASPHPGVELQCIQTLVRALIGKLGKASTAVRVTKRQDEFQVGDVIGTQGIAHESGHRQAWLAFAQNLIKPFTCVTHAGLIQHQSSSRIHRRRIARSPTHCYWHNGKTRRAIHPRTMLSSLFGCLLDQNPMRGVIQVEQLSVGSHRYHGQVSITAQVE